MLNFLLVWYKYIIIENCWDKLFWICDKKGIKFLLRIYCKVYVLCNLMVLK